MDVLFERACAGCMSARTSENHVDACLYAQTDNGHFGTAFLLRARGQTWIVTCAHLMPLSETFDDYATWPSVVSFHSRSATLHFALFDETGSSRSPRFLSHRDRLGKMRDFVAFPAGVALSVSTRNHVADEVAEQNASGQKITVHGFPKSEGRPIWPAEQRSLTVSNFHDWHLHTDETIERGFSGGPAVLESGQIVGMVLGNTDGKSVLMTTSLIADVIAAIAPEYV